MVNHGNRFIWYIIECKDGPKRFSIVDGVQFGTDDMELHDSAVCTELPICVLSSARDIWLRELVEEVKE